MSRALRVDKLVYAALEATLAAHVRGKAAEEIPVLRMLAVTADEIRRRALDLTARLAGLEIRHARSRAERFFRGWRRRSRLRDPELGRSPPIARSFRGEDSRGASPQRPADPRPHHGRPRAPRLENDPARRGADPGESLAVSLAQAQRGGSRDLDERSGSDRERQERGDRESKSGGSDGSSSPLACCPSWNARVTRRRVPSAVKKRSARGDEERWAHSLAR